MNRHLTAAEKATLVDYWHQVKDFNSIRDRARMTAEYGFELFGRRLSHQGILNIIHAARYPREEKENPTHVPVARIAFKEDVKAILEDDSVPRSQKSTRKIAQRLALSQTTVQNIMTRDLGLKAYKPQVVQVLTKKHQETRVACCKEFAKQDPFFWENTWFSDEAHFDLNGTINKQNDRWWSDSAPDYKVGQVAHPQRVTVFAAVHQTKGIVWCFMEGNIDTTKYIAALDANLFPKMRERQVDDADFSIWQQDGASCHTSHLSLAFLADQQFLAIVSKGAKGEFDLEWPPCSPDLNPCDYFLWGYLKSRVWTRKIETIAALKDAIVEEIALLDSVDRAKITHAIARFPERVNDCIAAAGGHFS